LDFKVIGKIDADILKLLFEYIEESDFPIITITSNLKK